MCPYESDDFRFAIDDNTKGGHKAENVFSQEEIPSLTEIKETVPRRCFESDPIVSLYYAFKDVAIILCIFALSVSILSYNQSTLTFLYLLPYIYVQGTYFTALFVVGHDCGHGSFSKYNSLNDTVGLILHTFLLCPYFPWKISHRVHHKNNCNIDKDEVFYPTRKSQYKEGFVLPYFGVFTGWFFYLVFGYSPRNECHFSLISKRHLAHFFNVLLSLAVYVLWCYTVFRLCQIFGMWNMFIHYFAPVCVFGGYITIITFLHHHDVGMPWYADNEWDYVRGQLSSIDRHYGWCHEIIHNIGTHQIHHLFPIIPHYNLEEATRFFRAKYPHLIRTCPGGIIAEFHYMYQRYAKKSVIDDHTMIHVY